MKQLAQMKETRPMELHDGVMSTTTDVWSILMAAKEGDLGRIRTLGSSCPALLWCQYDYTTPMQFAVREGHSEVVHHLVENGALDANDKNHPFLESIVTLADDRGFAEISNYLKECLQDPALVHHRGDSGKIDHGYSDDQITFQDHVTNGRYAEVKAMLDSDRSLAKDDLAFWGEGILSVPANKADRKMLELLMEYGASVPKLSKWGARYYFKHLEIGKFLLDNGMDPDHMNWREFTLLHDMAFTGEVDKARLLIEHRAQINAIDEEYKTTPLGYARHFGQLDMEKFLIEHGAH